MVNTRVRPKLGFGFGAETAKNLGFGLVSVTAVTRNLVAAWLRPPETQILSSANTESYYSLSLTQSLPARMLSWLLVAVVLSDPARRAKVVTPLAGSQWEFMLDSRKKIGVACITDKIREARLRWYGHVERSGDTNIRRIMKSEVQGLRSRGRQKKRWMDMIQEDLKFLNLKPDDTGRRNLWRQRIRVADPSPADLLQA